jgi:hypothetical protein
MGEDMNNTLICPNQLRKHGVIVEDCPSHLAPTNNPSSHSIICQDDGQELNWTKPTRCYLILSY